MTAPLPCGPTPDDARVAVIAVPTAARIEVDCFGCGRGISAGERYSVMLRPDARTRACRNCHPVPDEPTAHPENTCHRCGGPNVTWSAPSPLWNEVMRGGDINGPWQFNEIICPTCFAVLAEAAGVAEIWRFTAERVHVLLTTVTPSGRTWNETTWLWDDAPDHGDPARVALRRPDADTRDREATP